LILANSCCISVTPNLTCSISSITFLGTVSHPILPGKPNASHMCARINLHTHDRQKSVIPLQ
jgi:hypothetical protein